MAAALSKKLVSVQNTKSLVGTRVFAILWCGTSFTMFWTSAFGAGEDASNVGRGSPAQYVKVVGRGFTGEARGNDLGVRIAEIRLESTGKLPAVRYSALGIAVYRQGKILVAAWNHEINGELTSSAPSRTLTDHVFAIPFAGKACLEGGCEARRKRPAPGWGGRHG